ncbi:hypothetical protein [Caballeronia sordidicola]|uniref:hypothetical protein n=1 Tax=Caballeronia sordidicola TaxID=196367 RepID=UPI0004CFF526|nr:hypothetical protein [Caballeronia sordidicola]
MSIASSPGILSRLKSLKLQVAYLVLTLGCILFYWIDSQAVSLPGWVPKFPPYKSLGEACLTTLLVSFIYEFWIRREGQAELHQSILSPHVVKTVLNDESVNAVTRAGFQRMLRNDEFGAELFQYFTDLTFTEARRRYDVRTELTLLPLTVDTPFSYTDEQRAVYFNLRSSLSYRKPVRTSEIWFRCVSDRDSLRDILVEESIEWRWFVPQHPHFAGIDDSFFRVFQLEIDDRPIVIHKESDQGQVSYFARVPRDIRKKPSVRIRFKVDVKVRKAAQYLFTDIVHPVKDLVVSFDVAAVSEVREAGVIPIFSSVSRPRQDFSPTNVAPKKITIAVDGWSIPDSGVAFFWKMNNSLPTHQESTANGD